MELTKENIKERYNSASTQEELVELGKEIVSSIFGDKKNIDVIGDFIDEKTKVISFMYNGWIIVLAYRAVEDIFSAKIKLSISPDGQTTSIAIYNAALELYELSKLVQSLSTYANIDKVEVTKNEDK